MIAAWCEQFYVQDAAHRLYGAAEDIAEALITMLEISPARLKTFNPLRRCSQALFRWLLLDPIAAFCNGNDLDWRRSICRTEERCIGLVIGEILIDAPERVLG